MNIYAESGAPGGGPAGNAFKAGAVSDQSQLTAFIAGVALITFQFGDLHGGPTAIGDGNRPQGLVNLGADAIPGTFDI